MIQRVELVIQTHILGVYDCFSQPYGVEIPALSVKLISIFFSGKLKAPISERGWVGDQ
jgi:hypothetical protein